MRIGKYLIFLSLCVLILLFIVQYTLYENIKDQTIRNNVDRQLIHAKQAQSGINDYFKNVTNTLNFLSEFPEVIDLNEKGKRILNNYQELSSSEIKGVTRVDSKGTIIYTYPDNGQIGKNITYQDHIKLILQTHKTVVSDVFTAVQGYRTVAVHVPVFKNGKFDGTLAFLLSFDKIAEKYIEKIHVRKSGRAKVISAKGLEISSPEPDHIGKSVFELYKNYPELILMFKKMLEGKQGVTTYHFVRNGSNGNSEVIEHAVYLPIKLGNTFWSIVVATPEDEIIAALSDLRIKLWLITLALLMIYGITLYFIIDNKIISREHKKRIEVLSALKESEARYKTLFEQNPAPTLIYERGTFNILAVNVAFQHHYGYTNEEILKMRLMDLYPDDQKEKIAEVASGLKGYQNVGEWKHLKKDGSIINVIACSNDLFFNGRESRIAVITDVTERHITEDKIRTLNLELERRVAERTLELEAAKLRAESADQLKSAFLATMSHELRTPLNSIIGFTGILMKGIAGELNAEQLKQLGMAKSSAQHLLELINDVLDISKIEAGELVVSKKSFDYSKTIRKVLLSIQPFADKKGLKVESEISKDVGELISDERRVEQILLNLINNAVKFTDNGSIKIISEVKGKSIITKITDTGIGIKKEDLNKLFRPFSQIETGLTRNHDGTGLGLSICSKLIEKLNGTISVESEFGKGSTFTITLPI